MTTNTYNQTVAHNNDADFRAWGSAIAAALAACGLVQTADAGQIDWLTVLRPAINTAAGYEIWRFNDSLQATAPVYMKIEYGTGNGLQRPGMWVTVGTNSDGAGNITGGYIARRSFTTADNLPGGLTPAFFCHAEGFFGMGWIPFRSGAGTRLYGSLVLQRTCNSNGTPNDFGIDCINADQNPISSLMQVAARFKAVATPNIGGINLSSGDGTPPPQYANVIAPFIGLEYDYTYNRDDNGNLLPDTYHQIFPLWTILQPDYPAFGCCFAVQNDPYFGAGTIGSTFSISIGDFPARTYLNTGGGQAGPDVGAATEMQLFILWE